MISLSVPGKTFLLGEYVALDGGPSIIATTAPRFTLTLETTSAISDHPRHPFHERSPAARLIARHPDRFDQFKISFRDPHGGAGGLGASSAQFAMAYAALELRAPQTAEEWHRLLTEYRECTADGNGAAPSGADVMAQLSGGLVQVNGVTCDVERLGWNFPTLDFTLLRTGAKLATHEHLRESVAAPVAVLRTVALEARKALDAGDEGRFVEAVQACAHVLRASSLTADRTGDLLDKMKERADLIYAAKGCGAMGADVILVLHDRGRRTDVIDLARRMELEVCGDRSALSTGLEKEIDS